MELRAGFKKTDIGIIPENWEVTTFDMIADKSKKWSITGGPFGSNLKASDYTNDGVQIIQLQNIGDGYFIDDYQIYTSEEKANELVSCNIYPNEIIISKMGDPVARACFMPTKAKRYLMASDGIRLVVNEKDFSKKFIHDYINSPYFRKRAFENSRGSTRLRIGLPELKGLAVIKPTLSEQNSIANALSDTDYLIGSLEKLIAKKRNIKQGAMQKLLQPEEGWSVKNFGEVCDNISSGKSNTQSEDGQFPIYGSTGIIGWSKTNDYAGNKILVARVGANAGTVNIVDGKYCVSDNTLIVSLNPAMDIHFIFSFLILFQLNKLVFGSGQPLITGGQLKNILIPIPKSKEEQTRIANILFDMDAEITVLETKLEKYRKVKLGMMQSLLTGKIRLV